MTCRSKQLKQFRQLHSKTPGHPELGMKPRAWKPLPVRSARAWPMLSVSLWRKSCMAQRSTTAPNTTIVDHRTYVFLGDGCMMEGVSHEAASLAGTLGPGQAGLLLG
jgi:transketolase